MHVMFLRAIRTSVCHSRAIDKWSRAAALPHFYTHVSHCDRCTWYSCISNGPWCMPQNSQRHSQINIAYLIAKDVITATMRKLYVGCHVDCRGQIEGLFKVTECSAVDHVQYNAIQCAICRAPHTNRHAGAPYTTVGQLVHQIDQTEQF